MTTPARRRRPRGHAKFVILIILATLSVAGLAAAISSYMSHRPQKPQEPPNIDLTVVDPAIVAAVEQARAAVHAHEQSAAAWGHLGMVLLTHDFATEAKVCLRQAAQLDPGEPRWPYFLGFAERDEDANAAITQWERAVELFDATQLEPRLRLAEELLGQDRFDDAESHFRGVLQHDPHNAFALLGMSRVALRRGRPSEALEYASRSRGDGGPRKRLALLLAEIYQQQGNKTAAAEELRRSASLRDDPPRPDRLVEELAQLRTGERANIKRAQSLLDEGRVPQAITLLQHLVRQYPDSASAWLTLGRALGRQRQWAASEQALKTALQLAPDNPEVQVQMGVALFFQEKPNAESAFRQAIQLKPDCAPAYYNLGLCFMRQRRQAEAIDAFRSAVRLQPDLADAYIGLGSQLALQGRTFEALPALKRAVELNPADPRSRQMLRQALLRIQIPSVP
jgi:tetratricopeptide (TPR) repeat protein